MLKNKEVIMFSEVQQRVKKVGHPPGSPIYTGDPSSIEPVIIVITYDANNATEKTGRHLQDCLTEQNPTVTTWINIESLHDTDLIKQVAEMFKLHPLTIEDILNVGQRPKVEEFDNYLFVTLKVLLWQDETNTFSVSQLSLVIGKNYVLSFQELDTTRFDDLRKRLQSQNGQLLRKQTTDYLAYRMIDDVIDEYFIVLEALGDEIETIESRIISSPTPQNSRAIYRLKRQLLLLRKAIWPMREALSHLLNIDEELITKSTRLYLRDVYDHTMQAIDTLETFRDMLSSMLDMYLSGLTIRMNEIMKTLTIITTIFIPITALASIYGMNIPDVPLMHASYAFLPIASMMIAIAALMLLYFWKKEWI
jgi:magnesium transporter